MIKGDTMILNITFATEGVYQCESTVSAPGNDPESWHFTVVVQNPVTDATFSLVNDTGNFIDNFTYLMVENGYQKELEFAVFLPSTLLLPTNCSWSISFDSDNFSSADGEFISESDSTHSSMADYKHWKSWKRNYTVGGEYTVTLKLWNEVSTAELVVFLTVYEQISGLRITDVKHVVNMLFVYYVSSYC